MQKVRLGRTNVDVSVVGLGSGGHSRLGLGRGFDNEHAANIVRAALDMGVTFIDTARFYKTEDAIGMGISGRRDEVFLSTKFHPYLDGEFTSPEKFRANLELSLKALGTDYIDLYHLHGVRPNEVEHCRNVLIPEMKKFQEEGKIRFLGITERFIEDPQHVMFSDLLEENHFDVVMIGFSLLNPSARHRLIPITQKFDVGTLIMFAVRRALSDPEALGELLDGLIERGEIDPSQIDKADPLGFLPAHPEVKSVIEAAYRFCRHEPGAHVALTGTSSIDHLKENVDAILAPPLPPEILERLEAIFGKVDSVSGN